VGQETLAESFEGNRAHLRAVAYRMLGSLSEADDAVQEAWLRLSRSDTSAVQNLSGWLTTVVARVCLDLLRARKARREQSLEQPGAAVAVRETAPDPESESALADSVGLALLVVLETLAPAERLAFVLHDMFAVPFDEIASIMGSTSGAARQLASRARRRVQGGANVSEARLAQQRKVVDAFLAAVRSADFDALVALLHPDAVIHADRSGVPAGSPTELRGAPAVAQGAITLARGARFARSALVDGAPGIVVAPQGKLVRVLCFTVQEGRIVKIDVVADPARLEGFELGVLDA
jgi:RNA polymerase sigma factor (sigma-70 family)